jgi:hypothetical protein
MEISKANPKNKWRILGRPKHQMEIKISSKPNNITREEVQGIKKGKWKIHDFPQCQIK